MNLIVAYLPPLIPIQIVIMLLNFYSLLERPMTEVINLGSDQRLLNTYVVFTFLAFSAKAEEKDLLFLMSVVCS